MADNDNGTFEDFCKEVNRLLSEMGIKGTYADFWFNAYENNVLPNDALKQYIGEYL